MERETAKALPIVGQITNAMDVAETQATRWCVGGAFLIIAAWLWAAACFVQIEYFDGLSAIANARYFLGITDRYVADRGPMMALLLMPAEIARTAFGLHPMDVRPYHLFLALFHASYFIVVYRLLTRIFGHSWHVFVAWLAAIPNFVFFSYSPFVSHDIIPGAILLQMLIWSDHLSRHRSLPIWAGLVGMGASAALVKQTFGIFWIQLLAASLFQCGKSNTKDSRTTFVRMGYGALASGAITWLVLGCVLENADPQSPLLIRPLHNLQYLANVYKGKQAIFPLWIYLRNGPSYGWLSFLLVLPGWVLSMRGTRLQQAIAIAWIGSLVFLHLLPLREVRYMAFLSPLTACLLVPVLRIIAQRRIALVLAVLLLSLDVGRCAREALQIFHPFYTGGIERQFFHLLDDPENRKRPILVNAPMMSFVAPIPSPFAADRYHRVFHFGLVHLRLIYGCRDLRIIADSPSALRSASTCPGGSLLFYASEVVARGPSWSVGGPLADETFIQGAAICRSQAVSLLEVAQHGPAESEAVVIVRPPADEAGSVEIQGRACSESLLGELLPVLRIKSTGTSYWLRRIGPDSYAISGLRASESIIGAPGAEIRRFEVNRRASIKNAN